MTLSPWLYPRRAGPCLVTSDVSVQIIQVTDPLTDGLIMLFVSVIHLISEDVFFRVFFFYFVENMSFMVSRIKKIVVNCTNFLTSVTLVRKLVQFTTLCSLKLMRVRLVTASFNQFTTSFLSDN